MSRRNAAAGSLLAALLLGASPVARGLPNRVFVSARSGNDLNSCGDVRTPCQTLQGAVNQVAAGGGVLVLDSGGYGPVTITKAVTIEAPEGIEAFIHPPTGHAVAIYAGGSDVVVLRGLTLSIGAPNMMGVDVDRAGAVHIERCVIQGFYDGIVAARGGPSVYADVFIDDTVIRDSSFDGIGLYASGMVRATVDHSQIVRSAFAGIRSHERARTVVWKSLAAGNDVGFLITGRNSQETRAAIERSAATNNKTAGIQLDGNIFDAPATLWLSNSTFTGNGTGVQQLNTSQLFSRLDNTIEANTADTSGSISSYAAK